MTRSRTLSGSCSTPNLRITRAIWPPTRMARVERVERVLEHHLQVAHGLRPPLLHRHLAQILVVEHDLALGRGLEAEQDLGEGRLAAAGFADQGHGLGLAGDEVDLLVGLDRPDPLAPDDRHQASCRGSRSISSAPRPGARSGRARRRRRSRPPWAGPASRSPRSAGSASCGPADRAPPPS